MGLSAVDMEVHVPAGAQLDQPLEQGPEAGESGSEDSGRPRWRGGPARWEDSWRATRSGDSMQHAAIGTMERVAPGAAPCGHWALR